MMPQVKRSKFRIALSILLFGLLFFVFYLIYLQFAFRELDEAFLAQKKFVPTRIYSDVTRIAPPLVRSYVLGRLQQLGYPIASQPSDETTHSVQIRLREISYPDSLVPVEFSQAGLKGKSVDLFFESSKPDALLERIESEGVEIGEIYLEPELIATLARGEEETIRDFLPFEDIPSAVWKAIIAIEDQHFLDHRGFDPRGIARAFLVNLRHLSLKQGGSTLTQQLVKNLMARRSKNLFKKFNELFLAIGLELKYDKEKILERYLNEVYLGQIGNTEVHGVGEGAKYFFGKHLPDLNLGEIALMAGLIRGPGFYSPYRYMDRALERQKWVLQRMVEVQQIAPEEMEEALKMPIRLVPPPTASNRAPYFTDYVKAQLIDLLKERLTESEISGAGFRVYTTLDPWINELAQKAVEKGIETLEKRFPDFELQGALASLDQSTGYIRALIGGTNYRETNFNRILNMKRQIGSTFKPMVYLTALEKGKNTEGIPYSPAYPLLDEPWKYQYDKQEWSPKNYTNDFRGLVSLRTALAHSINVPTAKLGVELGINQIIQMTRRFGIESELPAVPSLALGVTEWSPVELLRFYSTMANRGVFDEPTVIRAIAQDDGAPFAHFQYAPQVILSEPIADAMTDLLQSVFTEGTARPALDMGFDRPAAGKTGTTSDYRDAWFAGYTPELTTVVWVGLDKGIALDEKGRHRLTLTGAGSALPIWVQFMKQALASHPPTPFPASPYLVHKGFDRLTGRPANSETPENLILMERALDVQ